LIRPKLHIHKFGAGKQKFFSKNSILISLKTLRSGKVPSPPGRTSRSSIYLQFIVAFLDPDPQVALLNPDPHVAFLNPDPQVAILSPDPQVAILSPDPQYHLNSNLNRVRSHDI
jgi:hypothetical protein